MQTPIIFESTGVGERAWDVFSKLMSSRTIFLTGPIDDDAANIICAQLNYLDSKGDDPINFYINSPGGYVSGLMAVYDTMQYINAPVHTLCIGRAASAAAVLLLAGAKGHRKSLKHSEIMLHNPSGGFGGKAEDVARAARRMISQQKEIIDIVHHHTGMSLDLVEREMANDWYMTSADAKEKGIIDSVIVKKARQK